MRQDLTPKKLRAWWVTNRWRGTRWARMLSRPPRVHSNLLSRHLDRSGSQEEVLDVAVALLERLRGDTSGPSFAPDRTNRETKDVDRVVEIGGELFALEHTSVDYSPQARRVSVFWREVSPSVVDLRDRLVQKIQEGEFCVAFWDQPLGPRRDVQLFLAAVADWVTEVAPTLESGVLGTLMKKIEAGSMSGKVRISRSPWPQRPAVVNLFAFDSRPLGAKAGAMSDIASQTATLRRAFAHKVPGKLAQYKQDGYTTVLVLQDVRTEATGFDGLRLGTHLMQTEHAQGLDLIMVVHADEFPWSVAWSNQTSINERALWRTNWWLWVPGDRVLVQNDWELGCRPTVERAAPEALARYLKTTRQPYDWLGGQWRRLA